MLLKDAIFISILLALPNRAFADNFSNCVKGAAYSAIAQGAPDAPSLFAVSDILAPDTEIIALSKVQPESKLPIWAYLWVLLDDVKIVDAKSNFATYREFLLQQEAKTGVDAATIAGIWGIETNFGKILGKRKVINALATMACGANSKRAAFFKKELIAAIRIEAKGHIGHDEFIGSWAGAFGQTQFMPTTFWSLAIDGNNDGRINLISQTEDALASTANYLKRAGWRKGIPWGFEVKVPAGVKITASRKNKQTLSYWLSKGIRPINNTEFDKSVKYGLIMPVGKNGPAYLVSKNFDAVYSYNGATSYALAVNLLADAIKNREINLNNWPTKDKQISRDQKMEIQTKLKQFGYEIGEIDGLIGMKAQSTIKDLYSKNGITFDGIVGNELYKTINMLTEKKK